MSPKKKGSGDSSNEKNAETQAELLETLRRAGHHRPSRTDDRFLISWQPRSRELCYGCLAKSQPMIVTSKRRLVKVDGGWVTPPRFDPRIAAEFVKNRDFGPDVPKTLDWCHLTLQSYLWLPDQRFYWLLTVWIIGTYCYPIFGHYGYLFLHSKFKRSGKTRTEEILSHLCFQSSHALNGPTAPALRETASEGGTVVLDTIERWQGRSPETFSALMEFLDAGFRNGGTVAKMVKRPDGAWERALIPVFAPYVLAAIERDSLADTALDRSFVIEMHRKPFSAKTRRYSYFVAEKELSELRQRLYVLALRLASQISKTYESRALDRDLECLCLNDRAADIWRPLFAIARTLGAGTMEQALVSLSVEMGVDAEAAEERRKLAVVVALRKRVNEDGNVVGMTSEFVSHLRAHGIEITENDLHDLLERWVFGQKPIRLPVGPRRAWKLADAKLGEIERQLSPQEAAKEKRRSLASETLHTPSQLATTVTTSTSPSTISSS
jgi:hypothetical protein